MSAAIADLEADLAAALEPEDKPQDGEEGYSIFSRSGGDPAKALNLADFHAGRVIDAQRQQETIRRVAAERRAQIDAWEQAQTARLQIEADWHRNALQQYMHDFRPAKGKTTVTPNGYRVGLRRTPERTAINRAAALSWALSDEARQADWVDWEPILRAKELAKALALDDLGNVVNKLTGEVIEPVEYVDGGEHLTAPLLTVTTPAGERLEVVDPSRGRGQKP